jgi:4-methylaminobutanoate oxidase (formaldehyde-forming)
VVTTAGRVEAEIVVCAAGIWSPRIARMAGVTIPLIPMQHQYAMTEPLAELRGIDALPNVRDPDNIVYIRQDGAFDCPRRLRARPCAVRRRSDSP